MSEKEYAGTRLALSLLFSLEPQLMEQCSPYSGWVFPPLFNL